MKQVKVVRWGSLASVAMLATWTAWAGGFRPIAVVASKDEAKEIVEAVLKPAGVVCEAVGWVNPADYRKYSVVYIGGEDEAFDVKSGWSKDMAPATVQKYLEEGGTIILGRTASSRLAQENMDAEILLAGLGKGRLLPLGESSYAYKRMCEQKKLPLTLDGAKGENILTEEGQKLEKLRKQSRALFLSAKGVQCELRDDSWGTEPLGKKGDLKAERKAFWEKVQRPDYLPRPVRQPGLVLVDRDVAVRVYVPNRKENDRYLPLANELAWHLEEMCGVEIKVLRQRPTRGPVIVLGAVPADFPDGAKGGTFAHEQTLIRRDGNRILVGGEDTGVSHGVTYLLEALGCRYLWPGKSGKVIPKKPLPLVLPELALDFTPAAHTRYVAGASSEKRQEVKPNPKDKGWRRHVDVMNCLGVNPLQRAQRVEDERFDREGNRDFWRWHGICDNEEGELTVPRSKAPWKMGHWFGDYWQTYGATHPEWFALQMNGSRYQHVGSRPNCPTLCLSNDELARETARRMVELLKVYTWKRGYTIGLPDGGNTEECMCRKCRELDPAMDAGDRWGWTFHDTTTGKSVSVRYPPMTDRYLVFANRVLSYVRETFPKAELTFYAYNAIEAPPSAVRPAEGLVCGSTAGDYKNPWELTQGVRSAIEWSHFCPVVWRPNILWAFRQSAAPQNFAKALGRDIEMIKRNGLIGAHFDCMGNEWSQKGLAYYMVAKTLLNPDRLSPEDIVDDYCTAGFGPAAGSVKAYFEELEREFVAAVWAFSKGKDEDMRFFPVQKMSEALDEKRLGGFLDQAEKEAAGDAALLGRIRFLRVSYSYAVQEKLMTALRMSGDEARLRNELKKYVGMIVRNIDEHPFAFEPLTVYRGGPFLRWYESAKGK